MTATVFHTAKATGASARCLPTDALTRTSSAEASESSITGRRRYG